jgi:hypothetical protein
MVREWRVEECMDRGKLLAGSAGVAVLQMGFESLCAYRERCLPFMANLHLGGAFARILVTGWVIAVWCVNAANESKTCS